MRLFMLSSVLYVKAGHQPQNPSNGKAMFRRLLNISYTGHITNEEVKSIINLDIGEYEEFTNLSDSESVRLAGDTSRWREVVSKCTNTPYDHPRSCAR